jgi:hypothetical protein
MELIAAGHKVLGLARSDAAAASGDRLRRRFNPATTQPCGSPLYLSRLA